MSEKSKISSKTKSKHPKSYLSGKKKKLYKFNPMFTAEWPCVIACDFSEYHTYCKLCDQVISVAHKGRGSVYRHITSNRHMQNGAAFKANKNKSPGPATPTQPEVIRVAPAEVDRAVQNEKSNLVKSNMKRKSKPISPTRPQVIRVSADTHHSPDITVMPEDVLQCIAVEGSYPLNMEMNDSNCATPEVDFTQTTTPNGIIEQADSGIHNYNVVSYQQKSFKPTTDMDDVNYMFGLSVIANLRQLPEKQASLARLKMQKILHEISYSYQ